MSLDLKPNFLSSWHHFLCPILHVYGHAQAKTHDTIAFAPSFLLLHWACAQDMSVLRGLSHSPLFILTATKLCQSNQPSSVQATFPSLSHSVLITTLRIVLVYIVYTGLQFEKWISFQTCSRLTSKNRGPEWNPNKALDFKRELKCSGQNSLCLICYLLGSWVLILLSLILFIQKIYKIFLLNVVLINDMCFVLSCSEVSNSLVGKIPWRRERLPTSAFLPGEFHGQTNLAGYSLWGHKESDMKNRNNHRFWTGVQIFLFLAA